MSAEMSSGPKVKIPPPPPSVSALRRAAADRRAVEIVGYRDAGWTQAQLADRLGVSRARIGALEKRGRRVLAAGG